MIQKELIIFLYSIAYGALYAFVYGILMTNRRNIKHLRITEYVENIIYFTAVTIVTIEFIILKNDGIFRGHIIYGILGGVIIYFMTIDKIVRPIHTFIINCFKELIKFIVLIIRWLCSAFYKILHFSCRKNKPKKSPQSIYNK